MNYSIFIVSLFFTFLSYAQAPTADFTANSTEVCLGDEVIFTDQSTAGGSPLDEWSWDFGDGNSSTLTNATHTYAVPGTYTVTLVVTALNGQADPEVKFDYIVVHPLPNAGFNVAGNACTVPIDVTFTNTSSTGGNITYAWDFGNGQTSTAQNPAPVNYASAGTFTVELVVTNTTTGCTNSFIQDVVVSDYAAGFDIPAEGCVGDPLPFLDMSTVGTNAWNWNFGDGNTSNQQNPSHTYATPGVYTVTLTAQNTTSGCSDIITDDIIIHDLPAPDFSADVTVGCAPLDVNFTNNSPGGVNYDWDFGNGSTFNGENPPTQTYAADGTYTVSLTMTDANGCSNTVTMPNLIEVSQPVVEFSMDVYNGCDPLTVQFSESSTSPDPFGDPIDTWTWDFGDGSPLFNGQNPPPHDYSVGVYSVTLTVETQNGCQATLTLIDTIQVGSIQNVNFSVDPIIECAKTDIEFTDLTTFNGAPDPADVTYDWDFGDGGTSTEQNPNYPYPNDTGYFDVTLIVSWRGCEDTMVMTDAVYIKAPISLFTPDQTLFCNPASLPITLNVTDDAILGVVPDDVEMTWKWGDGTTTFFDNAYLDANGDGSTSHNYNAYGSYTIEQVVHNFTTGCSDSTSQTIHVSQTDASFVLSNDSTCVGSPITLTSTSTSSHPFGTFSYNMGDGGNTSGNPATYTYNTSGAFDIVLTATNSVGCANTATFVGFDALALPQASITPSDVTGCAPITVTYNNTSTSVGNGVPLDSFFWTFPDLTNQTTTSVATNTQFSFTTEGVFTTSLVVTDEFGCVSPQTNVTMTITKPTASFVLDDVVCDLEAFTATNGSTGATSYEWFVDGASTSVATNFSSSFDEDTSPTANSVTHNVELIATDANGCMDTVSQLIVVSMPRADLIYTLDGANVNGAGEYTCPPVFAGFTDNSDTYGGIASWSWIFGDGKTSSLQDPNNTYVFAGTYTASLAIVDEFGCQSDTVLIDFLTIFGPSGEPNWTSLGDICGQTYIFDADNLVNVHDIIWDLGDGSIINDTNTFNYTYTSYETFFPTATIVDSLGCEVLYDLPDITIINNGLEAFFTATPQEGPMGTTFTIEDGSTFTAAPIVSWTWVINGDTLYAFNGNDISQSFGLPGDYYITLIVSDANGCVDKYTSFVTITDEFHLPNIITTNGDGVNEFFILPADIFSSFDIVILNRWGNVIYERNGATGVLLWDGTSNGNRVNDGVYFYLLRGTIVNGEEAKKHGNVTVVNGP